MTQTYSPPADATANVLARAAHPIKAHDMLVSTQGRLVKVRTVEHPLSTPDQPYFVATYALADETGRARRRPDGSPAVFGGVDAEASFGVGLAGEHHIIPVGEVAEHGVEHDYTELAARARLRQAERVARLDRARDEIGRLGRVKPLERPE